MTDAIIFNKTWKLDKINSLNVDYERKLSNNDTEYMNKIST
jgi:hypothetical protein